MSTFLERILAHKSQEWAARRAQVAEDALERAAGEAPAPRGFLVGLEPQWVALIAEVKRASPSKGAIAPALDAVEQARRYADGGADAVSVLTDREFYQGSLDDLRRVRAGVPMPVLCKDFLLDRYGLLAARAAGADMVLLIVAALERGALAGLVGATRALGMTPLVEVYTREEAETALDIGAELVGVNNRDLRTFDVSLATTERLAPLLADRAFVVSLSGMSTRDDVRRVVAAGARGVLVGEALVRAGDPAAVIRDMASVRLDAAYPSPPDPLSLTGRGGTRLPFSTPREKGQGDEGAEATFHSSCGRGGS